jgi:hypothetical protein
MRRLCQAFFEIELVLLGGADAGLQVGGGFALFGAGNCFRSAIGFRLTTAYLRD